MVLAAAVVGIVQWMPDGKSGDDDVADSRATRPAVATPAGTPASTPGAKASTSKSVAARGSMLTPQNIRIALDALKEKTGTTTFVDLTVYDGYVLASIPTAPGADTVDAWQYRDGAARRTGPDGTVEEGKPLIDMATVNWDAVPGLLEQSKKEFGVEKPTSTYVIIDPWMMDQVPAMRPYVSDEYGRGGYLLAGIDGKVKKATKL